MAKKAAKKKASAKPIPVSQEIAEPNKEMRFNNIRMNIPILGFTGALGSGCSYFAEGIEKVYEGYRHIRLSDPIRKV